ncbi:MAG: hypothetical protein KBT27_09430 [Prevotellaceae bacterium]|nr:hypothetical protein [Candidatus Faecinaster equi]
MFKKKFKIVEIRDKGIVITHYLHGKKHDVDLDIEAFKNISKKYEYMGKGAMIIWVE